MRPLSIVRGKAFREWVAELDPRYTLPTVPTIRDTLIPKVYNETMSELQTDLNNAKHVSMTTDGWTSKSADKYNAFTVHFINWSENKPILKSKILECAPFEAESGTSIEIEKEVRRIAEKYQLKEKLVLAVADNAPDVQHALELFGAQRLGCSAHKINLAAKYGIDNTPEISEVNTKLAKIVRLTKVSSGAKKCFSKALSKVGMRRKSSLYSFCKTRWNSSYLMADRALLMKDALILFFAEYKMDKKSKLEFLDEEDWENLVQMSVVLRPLYLVTKELSAEKHTTLSKVIPILTRLTDIYSKKIENENSIGKELRTKVLAKLEETFKICDTDEIYSISTIFDPRFKNLGFQNRTKAITAETLAKSDAINVAKETEMSTNDDENETENYDEISETQVNLVYNFMIHKINCMK